MSVPKCTPGAEVTVQAGSSPVHIGTLTGTALYTSVSSALEKLRPSVTQTKSPTACETGSVVVHDIEYVKRGQPRHRRRTGHQSSGEFVQLDHPAGLNDQICCLDRAEGLRTAKPLLQPDLHNSHEARRTPSVASIRRNKQFFALDCLEPVQGKGVFCNTAAFAGVGYFSAGWRKAQNPGAEAYIDATWEFQAASGGDFLCDFIEDLEIGLAVVAPEFAAGDLPSMPEVQAFCGGTFDR